MYSQQGITNQPTNQRTNKEILEQVKAELSIYGVYTSGGEVWLVKKIETHLWTK